MTYYVELFGNRSAQVQHSDLRLSEHKMPPASAYLVTRTYRGDKALDLGAHIQRLRASLHALGAECPLDDRQLREGIARVSAAIDGDARFRVAVSAAAPETAMVCAEPLAVPDAAVLQNGVDCALARGVLRHQAEVKSSTWVAERTGLPHSGTAYEVLLADESGAIYEGASSNFYVVWPAHRLASGAATRRPCLQSAGSGVLRGITRRAVWQLAARCCDLDEQAPRFDKHTAWNEAFITSSSRGIVPVRRIDTVVVGAPGSVTRALQRAYAQWIDENLESIYPNG